MKRGVVTRFKLDSELCVFWKRILVDLAELLWLGGFLRDYLWQNVFKPRVLIIPRLLDPVLSDGTWFNQVFAPALVKTQEFKKSEPITFWWV